MQPATSRRIPDAVAATVGAPTERSLSVPSVPTSRVGNDVVPDDVRVPGSEAEDGRRWLESPVISACLLLATAFGILVPFWPGLIHADVNTTIWEGVTGTYEDWWSPFLAVAWKAMIALGHGTGPIFLLQTALLVVGLYLCLRLMLPRVLAALAVATVCAFPPVYGQIVFLSRDVHYLALTFLGVGLLAVAWRTRGRRRAAAAGAAVLSAVAANLSRQNGLVNLALLVFALALLMITDPLWRPRRLALVGSITRCIWQWLAAGMTAGLACAVVLLGTSVVYDAADVLRLHPERQLLIYDLAAVSVAENESQFPADLVALPDGVMPPDLSLELQERDFDYRSVNSLYPFWDPTRADFRNEELAKVELTKLKSAWWDAVMDHPAPYVANRARLILSQLGVADRPVDAYIGLTDQLNFGQPISCNICYEVASEYIWDFVGNDPIVPLDIPWVYLLLSTVGAVYLWRRRGEIAVPILVMMATVWLNVLTLLAFAMGSGFRYGILIVPCSLVVIASVLGHERIALLDRKRLERAESIEPTPLVGDSHPLPLQGL